MGDKSILKNFESACQKVIEDGTAAATKHPINADFYLDRMSGQMLGIQAAIYVLVPDDDNFLDALVFIQSKYFDLGQAKTARIRSEINERDYEAVVSDE